MRNHTVPPTDAHAEEIGRLPPAVLATIRAIGGKWKVPVVWLLSLRARRFGELRRALPGVTQHMLTATLRELEADGLITRTVFAEIPPRVEYALTEDSKALCDVFLAMQAWGQRLVDGAGAPLTKP